MVEEKDQQALKTAEDYVLDTYTSLTRDDTRHWLLDDEEMQKLLYNEDGFLMASIKRSRIIKHYTEPENVWSIEVTPDVGVVLEPEVYLVYQGDDDDWIVEQ